MNNSHKIAIVYHYFAHYRRPILELLSARSGSTEYFPIADETAHLPSLTVLTRSDATLPASLVNKWRPVRNRWLRREVLWQEGLLREVMGPYDTFIFLGNPYYLSTWVGAILARLRGRRVYMWTHGVLRDEPGLKGLVRRTFYRLADGLLLYGQRAKQLLAAQGFDEKRLHVIYNSLDYEAQQQALAQIDPAVLAAARAQFGLDDNDRVIIAIARVTREKRFELLIEALALLTKTNPVYKLLVVGDGPYLQALRELAVKLKVDGQVFFCGASYDEVDIATKMSISDIAVVPGDVGLSCIHSLTYGLPMITHDKLDAHGPEFEAIIEGETGGFYAHGNVESLAALIDSWCTRMKAERRSIGERCQEVIAMHYTPAFQCQAIDSIVLEGR